jgi:hypothetical protein
MKLNGRISCIFLNGWLGWREMPNKKVVMVNFNKSSSLCFKFYTYHLIHYQTLLNFRSLKVLYNFDNL